jgi:hypothetical protein
MKKKIKKFKIYIVDNYIQSQDAYLVRWVFKKNNINNNTWLFLIDYMNILYLISLINEGMNVEFHKIIDNQKIMKYYQYL